MGVIVKQWKGAWWLFVNHQGQRKAKRVGEGEAGRKAAKEAAGKIQARLALGGEAFEERKPGVLFEDYAVTWLERIEQTRKASTHEDYGKMLERDILPHWRG